MPHLLGFDWREFVHEDSAGRFDLPMHPEKLSSTNLTVQQSPRPRCDLLELWHCWAELCLAPPSLLLFSPAIRPGSSWYETKPPIISFILRCIPTNLPGSLLPFSSSGSVSWLRSISTETSSKTSSHQLHKESTAFYLELQSRILFPEKFIDLPQYQLAWSKKGLDSFETSRAYSMAHFQFARTQQTCTSISWTITAIAALRTTFSSSNVFHPGSTVEYYCGVDKELEKLRALGIEKSHIWEDFLHLVAQISDRQVVINKSFLWSTWWVYGRGRLPPAK